MRSSGKRLPGEGIPQTLYSLMYSVEQRIQQHFRETRLHWGLRRILQQLWLQDGRSQKELSDVIGSSEASISNMLKHLVAGDWVERRQDEYDYRISRVYLTDNGRALRDAVQEELRQVDSEIRSQLGEKDAALLDGLLLRMASFPGSPMAGPAERFGSLADHPSPPGEL
ncbi:MarR family winged helix-turn-helix transcriptional regulator [Candidatus Bipolaricaulota bacterium]